MESSRVGTGELRKKNFPRADGPRVLAVVIAIPRILAVTSVRRFERLPLPRRSRARIRWSAAVQVTSDRDDEP